MTPYKPGLNRVKKRGWFGGVDKGAILVYLDGKTFIEGFIFSECCSCENEAQGLYSQFIENNPRAIYS